MNYSNFLLIEASWLSSVPNYGQPFLNKCQRCEVHYYGWWFTCEASEFISPKKLLSSNIRHFAHSKWKLYCSPPSPESYNVSPESLWEVRPIPIFSIYLPCSRKHIKQNKHVMDKAALSDAS